MTNLLWISLAGALGALARYGLSSLAQQFFQSNLPMGTALVNIVGCFLFGMIWIFAESHMDISADIRMIALVGFMGAFTTFSSYIFDTGELLISEQWMLAVVNLIGQIVLGLLSLFGGMAIARAL